MTIKISSGRYDVLSVVFVSVVDVVIVLSGLLTAPSFKTDTGSYCPPVPIVRKIVFMISPNCPKNVYKLHI